jgi:uncharacterized membrane protein YfcA
MTGFARLPQRGNHSMSAWSLSVPLILELLALGVVAGFLAGLLGIGGGMLMVPVLTMVFDAEGAARDISVKMAIATSMATIMFTSLSSVRAHHRKGAVRWPIVGGMAPGILVGGLVGGAGVFAIVKGHALALFFALFVGWSALNMLRKRKAHAHRQMPGWPVQAAAGSGIGLVSGLVGAGGGFLSVPFMTWGNVPIHQAIATSAALGFPIALANTLGYVIGGRHMAPALPGAFGYLYLPALVVISCASVVMAPIGARAAHALDVAQLKRIFAGLLFALAAYMLVRATRGA